LVITPVRLQGLTVANETLQLMIRNLQRTEVEVVYNTPTFRSSVLSATISQWW